MKIIRKIILSAALLVCLVLFGCGVQSWEQAAGEPTARLEAQVPVQTVNDMPELSVDEQAEKAVESAPAQLKEKLPETTTKEETTQSVKSWESTASESVTDEPAQGYTSTGQAEEIAQTQQLIERIDISFHFTHQSTMASNQFAVWIEDADGRMVKTLLVTNFTAARRGYRNRDMSLPAWVKAANPESMSGAEIDAISSATPSGGVLSYSWDMTDANGERVPDGVYAIKVEGTLFWESNVLYTAELDTMNETGSELPISTIRSEPDNTENENMLDNVHVSAIIGETGGEHK